MPLPVAIPVRVLRIVAVLGLTLFAACGDRDRDRASSEASPPTAAASEPAAADVSPGEGMAPETAELAVLLARAGEPGSLPEADRRQLEQAMRSVLLPAAAACDGCQTSVSYLDEETGRGWFRCDVSAPSGDPVAELQIFHRPDLPREAAKSWGRSTLDGHPASELGGEALFVWAGPFEIRAFARSESSRGGERLAALVESLPLDVLARL
jgi:hypothetical protein